LKVSVVNHTITVDEFSLHRLSLACSMLSSLLYALLLYVRSVVRARSATNVQPQIVIRSVFFVRAFSRDTRRTIIFLWDFAFMFLLFMAFLGAGIYSLYRVLPRAHRTTLKGPRVVVLSVVRNTKPLGFCAHVLAICDRSIDDVGDLRDLPSSPARKKLCLQGK
jgi:hypothetical protein